MPDLETLALPSANGETEIPDDASELDDPTEVVDDASDTEPAGRTRVSRSKASSRRPTERAEKDTEHLTWDQEGSFYRIRTGVQVDQLVAEEMSAIVTAPDPVDDASGRHLYVLQNKLSLRGKVKARLMAEANGWDVNEIVDLALDKLFAEMGDRTAPSRRAQMRAAAGLS